jgi:hypothetical protein
MNKQDIEREAKQIGLDIVIGIVILVFIIGFTAGAITN